MARITRAQWGAGPQKAGRISLPVSRLFLHHTVTAELTGAVAAQTLQRIALQRGFDDISYSWLVDVKGNKIEGRGWGRQGAHTKGFNSTAHAISLVGNFQNRVPTDAMINGVAELVREHASIGPDQITHGHRDVSQTACPGSKAYVLIPVINKRARLTEPEPTEEDDMWCDEGDTGRSVGLLQLRLTELGYYKGTIDKKYGSKTSAGLLAARRDAGSDTKTGGKTFNHWAEMQLRKLEAAT